MVGALSSKVEGIGSPRQGGRGGGPAGDGRGPGQRIAGDSPGGGSSHHWYVFPRSPKPSDQTDLKIEGPLASPAHPIATPIQLTREVVVEIVSPFSRSPTSQGLTISPQETPARPRADKGKRPAIQLATMMPSNMRPPYRPTILEDGRRLIEATHANMMDRQVSSPFSSDLFVDCLRSFRR